MKNAFEKLHPGLQLLYFAGALGCTMACKHPVYLAISLFCAAAYAGVLRGRAGLKFGVSAVLSTLLLSAVINGLTAHYGVTPLFRLPGGNRVTLEALCQGAVLGGMFGAASLWMYCFSCVVTQDKLLYLGARIMPALSLVLTMALRFLPVYTAQAGRIARARQGMGASQGGSKRERLRSSGMILSGLVTWALEHSVQTADSMRARGYGIARRSSYRRFGLGLREVWFALAFAAAAAMLIWSATQGGMAVQYDPVIRIPAHTWMQTIGYTVYGSYCAMPMLFVVKEALQWRKYA